MEEISPSASHCEFYGALLCNYTPDEPSFPPNLLIIQELLPSFNLESITHLKFIKIGPASLLTQPIYKVLLP